MGPHVFLGLLLCAYVFSTEGFSSCVLEVDVEGTASPVLVGPFLNHIPRLAHTTRQICQLGDMTTVPNLISDDPRQKLTFRRL